MTCTPASGSTFAIGTATVDCTATDASGNVATGSFTVDGRATSCRRCCTLPAAITVDAVGTTGGAPVTYTATATDDDRRFPNPAVTCTPASGPTSPSGPTPSAAPRPTTRATSPPGRSGWKWCDILPPVLTLPADINVNATVPEGAVVDFVATATDDDRRIPTPPVTCTPASGSMIAIGDTTVTCTATDLYGNAGHRLVQHPRRRGRPSSSADFVAASQGVGPGNTVASKVEKAQSDFAAGKVDKACKSLDDAIRQVELHTPKQDRSLRGRRPSRGCHPDQERDGLRVSGTPRRRHSPALPGRSAAGPGAPASAVKRHMRAPEDRFWARRRPLGSLRSSCACL